MSNKWRVSNDERVLGHFAAKTPQDAVTAAREKHKGYHPEVMKNGAKFSVVRAGNADAKVYEVVYEG